MNAGILIDFYKSVGPAGVILVFFAIYGSYLGIKNIIYIQLVRREFTKGFNDVVQSQTISSEKTYQGDNPLLAIIWDVVCTHGDHSSDIRAEVAYLFYRNFESVAKSLYWIRLITVIAPLLGLLGTVFGMVNVFRAIAEETSPDATVLASGIWEALLTTAMGLSIAIPMLMLYYFLLLRFKGFHIEAVEYSYRALGICKKNALDTNNSKCACQK